MSTAILARSFFAEYARNPVNLALLVIIPVVFVLLSADVLVEFADAVGAAADSGAVEANTAGWAAGFVAGASGFFQVAGARATDRRLALAGTGPFRVVVARLASSLALALLAALGGLLALAVRTGISDVPQTVIATLMFAVIFMAIGSAVGALVRDQVNGSVIVLFIWMLDAFMGPSMEGGNIFVTRLLPTHFVSLFLADAASGHGGLLGDLGWSLVWTGGALLVASLIAIASTRPPHEPAERMGLWPARRIMAMLGTAFTEYRRNIVLWALLAVVPVIFISLSIATTPDTLSPVRLAEAGRTEVVTLPMDDIHGAIMVPITVAFLAGLSGLWVVLGSNEGDRRLALTSFRASEILTARLGVVVLAGILVTVISLAVTSAQFSPTSWVLFAAGNLMVAVTYGLLGVSIGPVVGRVGGLYLMFLVPFIDLGIAQNIMFDAAPPDWGRLLPAHGGTRVLVDGAFTRSFDESWALVLGLCWIAGLAAVATGVFSRTAAAKRA